MLLSENVLRMTPKLRETLDSIVSEVSNAKELLEEEYKNLNEAKNQIRDASVKLELEKLELYKKQIEFEQQKKLCADVALQQQDKIHLNIGGTHMSTTKKTLCTIPGSMLHAVFSGEHKLPKDSDGRYFLDRDAKLFRHVLNFLRSRHKKVETWCGPQDSQIMDEFDYFCIPLPRVIATKATAIVFNEVNDVKTTNPANVRWCGQRLVTCGRDGLLLWDQQNDPYPENHVILYQDNVRCCDVEGNSIAIGCRNGSVVYIDMNHNNEKHVMDGHSTTVWSLKLVGGKVLTCSTDQTIKLWSPLQKTPLITFCGHKQEVWGLDSALGMVVSTSKDRTIKIWDIKDGRLIRSLDGHTRAVYTARILPLERRVVSASWDKTIKIWNIDTGACLNTLECEKPVTCFDIAGDLIVSGSENGMVKVWSLSSLKVISKHQAHTERVTSVAINGNLVATASFKESSVKVWKMGRRTVDEEDAEMMSEDKEKSTKEKWEGGGEQEEEKKVGGRGEGGEGPGMDVEYEVLQYAD